LRFKKKDQIEDIKTPNNKIRIIDSPNRNDNVFVGCSLIAKETKDFNKAWISKH
jgi:actin-related protein